jgi:uncharacterized protein with von Willebrand factor type A (vWA) domain
MALRDLLDRARGFLSRPKVVPAADAIWQHLFDQEAFNKLLPDAPALAEAIEELQYDYAYCHEMVRDVWAQFWQEDPRLRAQAEMDPRYLRNHAVATDVAALPETPELRAKTKHDRYAATLATLSLIDHIKDFLSQQDELAEAQEQAAKAAEEAEDAGGQAAAAESDAGAAMDALDAEMGEFDGNGPLTEGQAAAAAAAEACGLTLEQALELAEQAADAASATQQQAQELATQAQAKMRAEVRKAITESLETLEAEAELFAAWGIGPGEMQRMDFAERAARARQLNGHRLAKFRRMIGRYRYEAAAMQMKKVDYGRDEMVGVELSGDVSRLLEVELIDLTGDIEEMSLLAMARLASHQSLSRAYVGTEKVGQGAIICCIDNSGSMGAKVDGADVTREAMAKAMGLALLDDARANGRDFIAINFSSPGELSVWEFPKGTNDVDKVIAWTEEFFGGGPLRVDQRVVTPAGWQEIGSLKVNDFVYGLDGKPTKVTGVYPQGILELYKVKFSDGVEVVCNDTHLWTVAHRLHPSKWRTLRLSEIMQKGTKYWQMFNWRIPVTKPLEFPTRNLPLDPYLVGSLLGDGGFTNSSPRMTSAEADDMPWLQCLPDGVEAIDWENRPGFCPSFGLVSGRRGPRVNPLTESLRSIGLWSVVDKDKFIPDDYLWASIPQRWALLQGLCDTDGSVAGVGAVEFSTISEKLAVGVAQLAQSLGGLATVRTRPGRDNECLLYRVRMQLSQKDAPFRLRRKIAAWQPRPRPLVRSIVSIEPHFAAPAICIKVEREDGLFLTEGMVVTHNTDFASPLGVATDILEEHFNERGQARADIVMITDDECMVTPDFMREYQERKARLGFRVFGVQVGRDVTKGGFLDALCDHTNSVMEFMDPVPHLTEILRVA